MLLFEIQGDLLLKKKKYDKFHLVKKGTLKLLKPCGGHLRIPSTHVAIPTVTRGLFH